LNGDHHNPCLQKKEEKMTVRKEEVMDVSLPLELTVPIVEQALRQIGANVKARQPAMVFAHKGAS
jgi:hypothetical protein